jgi:predicted dithiol-disulfide oxidoreductase (DUF899 family)
MTDHKTGTREAWLAARLELLDAEKELTRLHGGLSDLLHDRGWVNRVRHSPGPP